MAGSTQFVDRTRDAVGPDWAQLRAELADALAALGVQTGDVVYFDGDIDRWDTGSDGADAACRAVLDAFGDALGDEGTLVVPTFTSSFCHQRPFDPNESPSACGRFCEFVRTRSDAVRSLDPLFSVTAIGPRADELTRDAPIECFGPGCFWQRLLIADGVFCSLNGPAVRGFINYVEARLNVGYRFNKLFTGTVVVDGESAPGSAVYYCRDLTDQSAKPCYESFNRLALEEGAARQVQVQGGQVTAIRARDALALIERAFADDPSVLTAGKSAGAGSDTEGKPKPAIEVALPADATMQEMIEGLWELPRDIISDGYDAALNALADQVPMTIHEYPTGMSAWTWIVPEKWTCRKACLETLDDRRVFSYDDSPLHVVAYSLPFEGEVSREELFQHLHVHPKLRDAIPYIFKFYDRDWGLCCSQATKESLTEPRYRVVIRTEFSRGTLKVGEVVAPGSTDDSIILCAHLCHPRMVNDDLAGVVVGMDVMRRLLARKDRRYTYRLLLLPETIGSIAYLSQNEDLIPRMKGGLFLEMLGLDNPHALQHSFTGDTRVDRCFRQVLAECDRDGWVGDYDTVISNDERQFNAPGVRVPMLSLSRVLPPSSPDWPFPQYHTSQDDLTHLSVQRLDESRDLVLAMLDALEADRVPVNNFKGEVFCSRYNIHVDFYKDPEGNRALLKTLHRIDGTRSISQIAEEIGARFSVVRNIVEKLADHGLVTWMDAGTGQEA